MQPGTPDLGMIVRKAQEMQANLQRAQADLADAEVVGTSGGGLVTATVTGSGELKALTLDPSVIDPADAETLADLVVAAVRDANRAAKVLSEETMGAVTGGMASLAGGLGLPPLPGL